MRLCTVIVRACAQSHAAVSSQTRELGVNEHFRMVTSQAIALFLEVENGSSFEVLSEQKVPLRSSACAMVASFVGRFEVSGEHDPALDRARVFAKDRRP